MATTSYADGHAHTYRNKAKFTSVDGGIMSGAHKHPIDWKRRIAKAFTPDKHIHRLEQGGK